MHTLFYGELLFLISVHIPRKSNLKFESFTIDFPSCFYTSKINLQKIHDNLSRLNFIGLLMETICSENIACYSGWFVMQSKTSLMKFGPLDETPDVGLLV